MVCVLSDDGIFNHTDPCKPCKPGLRCSGQFLQRTYKLGDGVSGLGSVADPVLPHRSLRMVPADGEAAGGGVKHTHVPGTSTGHCNGNTSDKHVFHM